MSKAVQGAAMLAGAVATGAAMFALGSTGVGIAAMPFLGHLMESLAVGGVAMEAGAAATALMQNRGVGITTRQPAAFRQIIYGTQRIGGTIIYQSTTGSKHDQWNFVIVLAGHEINAIQNLYLDGRQVFWTGSGVGNTTRNGINFGGNADHNTHIGPGGQHYNFGTLVYCEARFGDQSDGDVIGGLTANDPIWAASGGRSPWVGGCAYVYLKIEFDTAMFPTLPEIKFSVQGKNNIFDPRTSSSGYTANWALIVADVITDTVFGLGDSSVNQDQLIAAANVCDELVDLANGGQEARYACHYHYDAGMAPGDVLKVMMPAAMGRLSRIGGEWFIWPAYWQAPSFTFDESILSGPLQWNPNRSFRELINRVNGTYIAPNSPYNVAGNLYDGNGWYDGTIANQFPFAFQPTNYPQFAADPNHGYSSDAYLAEDGGIELPLQLVQSCVLSIAQAQRLAKIALLRNRFQGRGMMQMHLDAWQAQPLDVMEFTFDALSWSSKQLEIVSTGFRFEEQSQGEGSMSVLAVRFQAEVQETDESVYEWDAALEELPITGVAGNPLSLPFEIDPPSGLTLASSSATALLGADGVNIPRILATWDAPPSVLVTEVQIQYSLDSSPLDWIDAGAVDASITSAYISGVVAGDTYDVRIRSITATGAASDWLEADGCLVASPNSLEATYSISPQFPLTQPTSTAIDVAETTATFGAGSAVYSARTLTITAPSVPTWYYVTIADPTQQGESGSPTLTATASTSDSLVGVQGNTYLGAILCLPAGSATQILAGGWPAPQTVQVGG